MSRFLKYLIAIVIIAGIAPFMLPDGQGGRLLSWDELRWPSLTPALPDLDLGLPAGGPAEPRTVYKWRGADGSWHYGDQPPAGVDAQPVEVHPGQNVLPAPKPPTDDESEAESHGSSIQRARKAADAAKARGQRLERALNGEQR